MLSGGEYLAFPVEGKSIKNDGLNRLITVVTAALTPYQQNGHCFKGAIPRVMRLPVGVTKLLALHTTRPNRKAQLRPVAGLWCGGFSVYSFWWGYRVEWWVCHNQRFLNNTASQPSIIYFNYPIFNYSVFPVL